MLNALISHYSNGNKSKFANMLGVSPQAVSTWEKRNTFDIELVYAKCENLNAQWLLTGNGEMLLAQPASTTSMPILHTDTTATAPTLSDPTNGIPYYDVDFLGGFDLIINSQTTIPTHYIKVPGFEKATAWCNVTGHSMEPKINHGDIIALRQCTISDIQYGEVYAIILDTIRTIKILRRGSTPQHLRYVPINTTAFDEQEFPISRIISIFEVIGSIAKFF